MPKFRPRYPKPLDAAARARRDALQVREAMRAYSDSGDYLTALYAAPKRPQTMPPRDPAGVLVDLVSARRASHAADKALDAGYLWYHGKRGWRRLRRAGKTSWFSQDKNWFRIPCFYGKHHKIIFTSRNICTTVECAGIPICVAIERFWR